MHSPHREAAQWDKETGSLPFSYLPVASVSLSANPFPIEIPEKDSGLRAVESLELAKATISYSCLLSGRTPGRGQS